MKFLCLECNTGMKFKETTSPEEGSLAAVFECPGCFAEIAMHMNPWETQMLKSLDVKIGGRTEPPQPMQMVRAFLNSEPDGTTEGVHTAESPVIPRDSMNQASVEGGKCPFTSVVSEAFQKTARPDVPDLIWTEEALERLQRVPTFVQSMAKEGIESFAREKGYMEITAEVMESAKRNIGM